MKYEDGSLPVRRYIVPATAITVFLVHFLLTSEYSLTVINNNSVNVILESLRGLAFSKNLLPWYHQINVYTGNPFLLLPAFTYLDFSPAMMRATLISFMAGASTFAFLSYQNIFDLEKAVVGTLLLLNIDTWILFRHADYTYAAFFPMVLLFLYTSWDRNGKKLALYAGSFLAGLFFYFKAVAAYTVASLFAGKLTSDGPSFIREMNRSTIAISFVLLVVGLFPFLRVAYGMPDVIVKELTTGVELSGVVHPVLDRVGQFSYLIGPRNTNIPYGDFSGFNVFSALLLLGAAVSLYRRRNLDLTVAFTTFLGLMMYVPHSYRWTQLVALLPFAPLLMLNLLDEAPERFHAETVSSAVLTLMLVASLPALNSYTSSNSYDSNWGGTQPEFNDYSKLEIEGELATNSYRAWILSRYDSGIRESTLLMPVDSRQLTRGQWRRWRNLLSKGSGTTDEYSPGNRTTFLVQNDLGCKGIREERCGYHAEDFEREYGLNFSNAKEVDIVGRKYLLLRP